MIRGSVFNILKKCEINYLRREGIYITHLIVLRLKFNDDIVFRDYVKTKLLKNAWFN